MRFWIQEAESLGRLTLRHRLLYCGLMTTTRYRFSPVGLDLFDRRTHQPAPGTIVVKTQPAGCPRNGTMGHCYVADAETGAFYGLVLVASLSRVK
jgi:hypothetical protein